MVTGGSQLQQTTNRYVLLQSLILDPTSPFHFDNSAPILEGLSGYFLFSIFGPEISARASISLCLGLGVVSYHPL